MFSKRFYSFTFTNNSRTDVLLILNFFYSKNWTWINGHKNDPKQYTASIFHSASEIGHEISRSGIEGTLQQSVKIRSNSPKSLERNEQQLYRVDHENSLFEDLLRYPPIPSV